MYVCALKNCELERVLNITYDSFAISVVSSFNNIENIKDVKDLCKECKINLNL